MLNLTADKVVIDSQYGSCVQEFNKLLPKLGTVNDSITLFSVAQSRERGQNEIVPLNFWGDYDEAYEQMIAGTYDFVNAEFTPIDTVVEALVQRGLIAPIPDNLYVEVWW